MRRFHSRKLSHWRILEKWKYALRLVNVDSVFTFDGSQLHEGNLHLKYLDLLIPVHRHILDLNTLMWAVVTRLYLG